MKDVKRRLYGAYRRKLIVFKDVLLKKIIIILYCANERFIHYLDCANVPLRLISELIDSKTILIAYHADDPNVGLSAYKDINKFKLYLADTGLFVTSIFKDRDFTANVIYEKLQNDKLSANLGYLFENIVAQTLVANGNKLFYYTFYNEMSHRNYEIDFLVAEKK